MSAAVFVVYKHAPIECVDIRRQEEAGWIVRVWPRPGGAEMVFDWPQMGSIELSHADLATIARAFDDLASQ